MKTHGFLITGLLLLTAAVTLAAEGPVTQVRLVGTNNAVLVMNQSQPAVGATNVPGATFVVKPEESTNKVQNLDGTTLAVTSTPINPASWVTTVTPYCAVAAVTPGKALCYNFEVPLTRTNGWLTSIKVVDTDTNATPASLVLKDFELWLFNDAVTAQTPASDILLTEADMAKYSSGPWRFYTAMYSTNSLSSGYGDGKTVYIPGAAATNNLVVLCVPANGAKLRGVIKAMGSYTPGNSVASNTNKLMFLFKFLADQ